MTPRETGILAYNVFTLVLWTPLLTGAYTIIGTTLSVLVVLATLLSPVRAVGLMLQFLGEYWKEGNSSTDLVHETEGTDKCETDHVQHISVSSRQSFVSSRLTPTSIPHTSQ